MAESLAVAFLAVKMRDPKKSRALYAASSDVECAKIPEVAATQVNRAIVGLLKSAPEVLTTDLELMATVRQSTIAGMKRQLLESDMPEAQFEVMQRELVSMVRSYARAYVGQEHPKLAAAPANGSITNWMGAAPWVSPAKKIYLREPNSQ